MYLRITRAQCEQQRGGGNRLAMKGWWRRGRRPASSPATPGGAVGGVPSGRDGFGALERSRRLKRGRSPGVVGGLLLHGEGIPERGLMGMLLEAAVAYARDNGASILEGCPISVGGVLKGCDGYMGIDKTFAAAGFEEVARPHEDQLIIRRYLR